MERGGRMAERGARALAQAHAQAPRLPGERTDAGVNAVGLPPKCNRNGRERGGAPYLVGLVPLLPRALSTFRILRTLK